MSTTLQPDQAERTRVTASDSSVRVNLLPEATRASSRAARQRAIAGALGAVFIAGLGGVYWSATNQVSKAENELAEAELVTTTLRAEADELVAFKVMAEQRDVTLQSLAVAMGDEVSVAAILQDFALVVPTDTEFTTLNIQIAPSELGDVGSFALTGRTLNSHAPGVERTLLQLDKVTSFIDLYLNASALDELDEQVATFSLDGNVDEGAATRRYADGLPKELR